jgi:transcription elongation factor SPT5
MVCNALTRQGKEGPIEHIHRGILFIHDRHHLENGGFLCVRARACLALGGSHRGMERPVSVYHVHGKYLSDVGREGGTVIIFLFQQLHVQEEARLFYVQFFPQMWQDDDTLNEMQKFGASMSNGLNSSVNVLQSPRRDTPYVPTGNFPRGRGGFRRDDGVVGRTVKVRMGPFKGYRGRVVDATDSTVRIELESQMKVVTGAGPSVGWTALLLWTFTIEITVAVDIIYLSIMATHDHLMFLVVCS